MNSKKNEKLNLFGLIGRILSYFILSVLIILCSFFAFFIAENAIAKSTGTKPILSIYVIVSPSMVPTINVYDMIIDTGVNSDAELKKDDIVTFYSTVINTGGYTITHRINSINKDNSDVRYITKGDNNASVDVGFTTLDNIVGKVQLIIPKIGKLQKILSSKWGWLCVVLIPTIAILISDIVKLIGLYRIKHELVDIPDLGSAIHKEELESNKNIRVLLEKSKKLEEKGDNNEEGASSKEGTGLSD